MRVSTCMYVRLTCIDRCLYAFRGLPCKDPVEEQRHRQQYQQMVEAAKRKGTHMYEYEYDVIMTRQLNRCLELCGIDSS